MARPKGFKHTQETKDKIRQSLLGHPVSDETRQKIGETSIGRQSWNKGKAWSNEIKQKISATNKVKGIRPISRYTESGPDHHSWNGGRPKCIECGKQLRAYGATRCKACVCKGDRAYNWKGGVRTEYEKLRGSIEFRHWRRAVFVRDAWTCQKTGTKGGRLHSHHILNFSEYPELRFDVDNGITLSDQAHKDFHNTYGKTNNTVGQIEQFIGRSIRNGTLEGAS
jgi:hypothetical protein